MSQPQTVRNLIRRSMMLVGMLGQGENPSAAEATDALETFNEMIEKWNLERLMLFSVKTMTFPLTAGKSVYTVGPSGDFDMPRPVQKLNGAWLNDATGSNPAATFPLTELTIQQFNGICVKDISDSLPQYYTYNNEFPLGSFTFFPIPNAANTVSIQYAAQLDGFDSLDDEVSFPPGYSKALRYGLAAELANEYGRPLDQGVVAAGVGAKAAIKGTNTPFEVMGIDSCLMRGTATGRGFNFYTGQ